jgi:hypothetical protein
MGIAVGFWSETWGWQAASSKLMLTKTIKTTDAIGRLSSIKPHP